MPLAIPKRLAALAALAAAAGAAAFLWPRQQSTHEAHVQLAPQRATRPATIAAPTEVKPRIELARPLDANAADAAREYRRTRLIGSAGEMFDRWVRESHVSPEQEATVLKLLADAQQVYDETEDLRDTLGREAIDKRTARMSTEQREALTAARQRYSKSLRGSNDDERAAAASQYFELRNRINADLNDSAPSEEEAAFADAAQVERDLDAQVNAELAKLLTPEQLDSFLGASTYLSLAQTPRQRQRQALAQP